MAQFNLYLHGVPIGHEVYPRDDEEEYLKEFYSHDKDVAETSFMQIDIVNGKSFYSYLHKKNVSSEIGRPGSYFGLTVSFFNQYCTNVHMLYEILETIYQKICVGCLVKQEFGNERFIVKEIASAQYKGKLVFDYIKLAFKQNLEKYLSNDFEDLDGFSNSVDEIKFNLSEVDSPLFIESLKNKRILVSSEYEIISVAYNKLLKELIPLREDHTQIKQDNEQLQEKNNSLTAEVSRLKTALSNAEDSADKKYKVQLKEAQINLKEIVKKNERLEEIIKEATDAFNLIGEPIKGLSHLLANQFPKEGEQETKKITDYLSNRKNTNGKFKTWFLLVFIVLFLCLLALCGYNSYVLSKINESVSISKISNPNTVVDANANKASLDIFPESDKKENVKLNQEPNISTLSEHPTFDDFSLCRIDIPEYNGNGSFRKEKEYSLRVVIKTSGINAKVPEGRWEATTNSEELPGIVINGNKFTVDENVSAQTNVLIYYVVDNSRVLCRTITIN